MEVLASIFATRDTNDLHFNTSVIYTLNRTAMSNLQQEKHTSFCYDVIFHRLTEDIQKHPSVSLSQLGDSQAKILQYLGDFHEKKNTVFFK